MTSVAHVSGRLGVGTVALGLLLAIAPRAFGQGSLDITLKHGSPSEAATRDQLMKLAAKYDLSPWIYTKNLEQQADVRLLGELMTKQVMEFWATDHYTWVYQTVIGRGRDIGQIMRNRKLIPAR